MEFRFAPFLISVVIGVVLVATILIPIVSDATATEDTFTNEGYFYMAKINATDAEEYVFDYAYNSGDDTLTLNDVDVVIGTDKPVTIATDGETWFVRYDPNNGLIRLQILGESLIYGGSAADTMQATLSAGTITFVGQDSENNETTYTKSYTTAYIYSPEKADYVMKKADKPAYMNGDTEFIAMGQTTITQWYDSLKILGTVSDGFTVDILVPEKTLTVTNKVIDAPAVNGYEDLYALNKITFTVGYDDASTDATYSYFIVPASVTADRSQPMTSTEIALMSIIPLLVVIGLIIGVVFIVGRRAELF